MEQVSDNIQGISFERLAQTILAIDNSMREFAVKTINQAADTTELDYRWLYCRI